MIVHPALLICDEPVSSLDVSIQGQIVNLLVDVQRASGMSLLFISHNLAIVRHISDRVLVLFKGELVETAACSQLFSAPGHPYTIELLQAAAGTPTGSYRRGGALRRWLCIQRPLCLRAAAVPHRGRRRWLNLRPSIAPPAIERVKSQIPISFAHDRP